MGFSALPKLSLTPREQLFRKCLLDCRDSMQDVPGMKDLVLRWTGGWVRDKLLNVPSVDIDVGLSTMTGEQYAKALQAYMSQHSTKYEEEATKQGFKAELKNLHKIEANPEKSKHLETITTRMFGIDVDFVNLRKEVYTQDSRNPQVEFGTAGEDALRRDATVNALFYNLDTQLVEDLTGQGLDDMQKKIIRTPLEPHQTFMDDPLRVLRLIRFAARLGYTVEEKCLKAMADPEIHQALMKKISRERVGVEIGKIMTGPDAYGGLTRVYDLNLYKTVFADPESIHNAPREENYPDAVAALRRVLEEQSYICLVIKPKDDITAAWSLAAYVQYNQFHPEVAVLASRNAIKATNQISKLIGDAVKHRLAIESAVQQVHAGQGSRVFVGALLRAAGTTWRHQLLYSLLCDATISSFDTIVESYQSFVRYIHEQDLEGAAELKPILNGNEVKTALDVQKAGPWLKAAIDEVVEWQFAHPQGSAAEAKAWLVESKEAILKKVTG
ncbi:CCA tRNA nucleotidyltransferase, mitochondrial [Elasticomyces elasticus]|nr:CCA tRNA nucleotidyltransferase, mitochondrial [Elasticomyces elasticus]